MSTIEELALSCFEGVTYAVCPACNGGSRKRNCLRLSREGDKAFYSCFRASCGLKGVCFGLHSVPDAREQQPSRHVEELPTQQLSLDEARYIESRYGLRPAPDKMRYTDKWGGRYYFPLFTPYGDVYGYCLKATMPGQEPKNVLQYNTEYRFGSWYKGSSYTLPCVVVEDILSAMRLKDSGRATGVALLGVSPGEDLLEHLQEYDVVWALDADAWERCIQLHNMYGHRCKSSRVGYIPKDIKDMTREELDAWLGT